MTLKHRIRFFQQLAVLARAGVPLRSSLERLQDRFSGHEVATLRQRLETGSTVSEAFTAARFTPFERNLITAGERSARLDTVYQHIADFWSRQHEMVRALTGQVYYPFIVLNLTVLVGGLIDEASNPWPVMIMHMVLRFAFLYAFLFALYTLLRVSWHSDAAQVVWLNLPIIGPALSASCAYRWITALKLEYGAGVPMPTAAADAWRASGYAGRDEFAREADHALREGTELSVLVQKWRRLPRDWVDFIETGEISGALDTAFETLEAEAGRDWRTAQERVTMWMPKIAYFLILLVVGLDVLFVALDALHKYVTGPIDDALKMAQP